MDENNKINECMGGISGTEEIVIAAISLIPSVAIGFIAFKYLQNKKKDKEQPETHVTDCSLNNPKNNLSVNKYSLL